MKAIVECSQSIILNTGRVNFEDSFLNVCTRKLMDWILKAICIIIIKNSEVTHDPWHLLA